MDSKQERAVRELLADIRDQLNDGVDDTVSILERTEDLLADLLPVPGEVDVDLDESCEDCGSTVAAHIPYIEMPLPVAVEIDFDLFARNGIDHADMSWMRLMVRDVVRALNVIAYSAESEDS